MIYHLHLTQGISIHALREEGDHDYFTSCLPSPLFLSTPSARRATAWRYPTVIVQNISIHALREEGDMRYARKSAKAPIISIHALREEGDRQTRTDTAIL